MTDKGNREIASIMYSRDVNDVRRNKDDRSDTADRCDIYCKRRCQIR